MVVPFIAKILTHELKYSALSCIGLSYIVPLSCIGPGFGSCEFPLIYCPNFDPRLAVIDNDMVFFIFFLFLALKNENNLFQFKFA